MNQKTLVMQLRYAVSLDIFKMTGHRWGLRSQKEFATHILLW